MTATGPDPSSATATRARRVGVSASSHVTARRSAVSASEPGHGQERARGERGASARRPARRGATRRRARASPISPSIRTTAAPGPCVSQTSWGKGGAPVPRSLRTARAAPRRRRAFAGIRLERLEALARVREPAVERRQVVASFRPRGGGARGRAPRARGGATTPSATRGVWTDLGERQPGDGLLPLRDERLARQRKAGPQRAREGALAQLDERPRGVGGQVAEDAAEGLAVVDAHLPPELRVERRRERDALGRGAGARREALGRLAEENLGPRIGRPFGPEAGGAPREERRREREARVVGREVAADDDEVPAALRAWGEEGVGRERRETKRKIS